MSDLQRLESVLNLARAGFTSAEIARRLDCTPSQAERLLTRAFRTFCRAPAESARHVMLQRLELVQAHLLAIIAPLPAEYQGPRQPVTEEAGRALAAFVKVSDLAARCAGFHVLQPLQPAEPGRYSFQVLQFTLNQAPALPGSEPLTLEHQASQDAEPEPQGQGSRSQDEENPPPVIGAPSSRAVSLPVNLDHVPA